MKLLNKTQLYYLSLLAVLLVVWTGVFLYVISSVIQAGIDETLQSQMQSSISRMKSQSLSYFTSYEQANSRIQISVIDSIRHAGAVFSDTILFNSAEKERTPYRQISAEFMFGGHPIKMTLRKSTVEYDDLFYAILLTELLFVAMLIITLYLMNRQLLQKLWKPFFGTLNKAEHYRITRDESLALPETNIREFTRLNEVLMHMTKRMEHDYQSLKQFTENASHEIQTPLASISNQVELLLQNESLSESEWKNLKNIEQSARQLSRLNKALLLLTKIENQQYVNAQPILISEMLNRLVVEYRELAEARGINVTLDTVAGTTITMNMELAEMMLRNLLSNAIKHNNEGGLISIRLHDDKLTIANTGNPPKDDPALFFERFSKASPYSNSLGLGLSIVAAIAATNDINLSYSYENELHVIRLTLDSSQKNDW